MKRYLLVLLVVAALLAGWAAWRFARAAQRAAAQPAISMTAADSMERKLAQLLAQAANPQRSPTTFLLSEDEVNSYFQYKIPAKIPKGIYDLRFRLRPNQPSAAAVMDFDELKAASKRPLNPLLDQLLSGRKPVAVVGRFTSSNSSGVFHLEQVSMRSFTLSGMLLDLVVRHFVQPRYPQAAIDRPFTLPANIDQLVVEEGRVRIVQK